MNTRTRRCSSSTRRARRNSRKVNRGARRADRARQPPARRATASRRRKRRFRQIAECRYARPGLRAARRNAGRPLTAASAAVVNENFYNAHKQVYGHAFRDQSCEIITLRVVATVEVETLTLPKLAKGGRDNPADAVLYAGARSSTTARRGRRRATQREKLLADDRDRRSGADRPAQLHHARAARLRRDGDEPIGDMLIGRAEGGGDGEAKSTPSRLQVIGGALHSIAEQMGNVLYRMSYSSIIRESQDLGAGLFDRDYNTLCESDFTPMHIGSLPGYLRGIEKTVPLDAWKPGDCVIHNHPYYGASHSPDIAIVMPVFFERRAGRLLGQHRASCRYRRGNAGPRHRHSRRLRRRHAAQRPEALRRGRAQRGAVEIHPRQYARARAW